MGLKNKNYISLIIWILLLMLIGSSIGALTKNNINNWYMTLNRSPLTPPNYLFGIAWTILYIMIATAGWLIWSLDKSRCLSLIKRFYVIQLVLNWAWTPLFFSYHMTGAALVCLSFIIFFVGGIIIKSYKQNSFIPAFLTPYSLWLLFAAYLNLYIWLYN